MALRIDCFLFQLYVSAGQFMKRRDALARSLPIWNSVQMLYKFPSILRITVLCKILYISCSASFP